MKLFRAKYDEWSGPFDDELIEIMINFIEITDYKEQVEIFKTLMMYFPFQSVYDKRVVIKLLEFLPNPQFTKECFCKLIIILSMNLNYDQSIELCELIDVELTDAEIILEECEDAQEVGEMFFELYEKWKKQINISV